ncbi:hypothetical protein D3C80_1626340 [compost metagenome]
MVFVEAILVRIVIRLFTAEHDGAVIDLHAFFITAGIDNAGDELGAVCAIDIIHHAQETLLIGLNVGNR